MPSGPVHYVLSTCIQTFAYWELQWHCNLSTRASYWISLINIIFPWYRVIENEKKKLHHSMFVSYCSLHCPWLSKLHANDWIVGHWWSFAACPSLPCCKKVMISWFAWWAPRYTWKFWLERTSRICFRPSIQRQKIMLLGIEPIKTQGFWYKCYLKELSTNNPLLPIWLVLLYLPRRGGKEVRRGTFPVTYFCTTFLEGVTQGGGVIQTAVLSPYTPPSTSLLWRLHYCQCNLSWIFQTSYLLNFQVWLVCNDVWYSMPVT